MTGAGKSDRLIHAFLNEEELDLPERVYDTVRDHIDHQRQRVAVGPWREPDMSDPARILLAAAAVVVVAFGAFQLFQSGPATGGSATPSPTASPPQTATAGPSPSSAAASDTTPGTFVIDEPFAARVTFQAGPGWTLWGDVGSAGKGWYKNSVNPPIGMGLTFWDATNVFVDACHGVLLDPPIDESVDALADALVAQSDTVIVEDSEVTLGGYSGRYLEYRAAPDLSACQNGELLRWATGGGADRVAIVDEHDRVWILDVDGSRVIIDAFYFSGTPANDLAELQAMIDSIQIDPN